jgi:hypothetical protein
MKLFFTTPICSYPVNRPLNSYEKEHQVSQKERSPCQPWFELSVIKMNSTFLECPDKWFADKGTVTGPAIPLVAAFAGFMLAVPIIILMQWSTSSNEDRLLGVFFTLFVFFSFGGMLWLGTYFFRKETFRYTHYPMRFNRKTRKVYRFRDDGTIMTEHWDKLFFCLGATGMGNLEVRGYRLAKDRETVLEIFPLQSHAVASEPNLLAQWEFVRHFMEEGPAKLVKNVPVVQDIADRREKFWDGFQRLQASGAGPFALLAIITAPLNLFYAIGRWIAMHTCKIPVWPPEIEAECQFEPNDPYIRDRDHLADPNTVDLPENSAAKRLHERRRLRKN